MLALRYSAFAALMLLAGVAFGWKAPIAVALVIAALVLRVRIETRWPKRLYPNRVVVALDLTVSGLVGGIIGGLAFGGVGAIIGFAMGFAASLGSIPLSTRDAKGNRQPLTLQTSPATARGLTLFGFALPLILSATCVLILVDH
jgi:hypothetical protein